MKNTLVISGHPNLKASQCNRFILEQYEKNIPNVTVHKLDDYDYKFDIEKEQEALIKADIVVLQFPVWVVQPAERP